MLCFVHFIQSSHLIFQMSYSIFVFLFFLEGSFAAYNEIKIINFTLLGRLNCGHFGKGLLEFDGDGIIGQTELIFFF